MNAKKVKIIVVQSKGFSLKAKNWHSKNDKIARNQL